MIRGILAVFLLLGCLLLSGCGYSVVEDKRVTEIGTGDTYVAPRATLFEDPRVPEE